MDFIVKSMNAKGNCYLQIAFGVACDDNTQHGLNSSSQNVFPYFLLLNKRRRKVKTTTYSSMRHFNVNVCMEWRRMSNPSNPPAAYEHNIFAKEQISNNSKQTNLNNTHSITDIHTNGVTSTKMKCEITKETANPGISLRVIILTKHNTTSHNQYRQQWWKDLDGVFTDGSRFSRPTGTSKPERKGKKCVFLCQMSSDSGSFVRCNGYASQLFDMENRLFQGWNLCAV